MEFPTIDKFAKEVAEKSLDEITYEGKTMMWILMDIVVIMACVGFLVMALGFMDYIIEMQTEKEKKMANERACVNCGKPESEWNNHKPGFRVGFVYNIEGSDEDMYVCPDCLEMRIVVILKRKGEADDE